MAGVIPKIEFIAVTMKMSLANMMKGAVDTALQERKEAFRRVGISFASHVLASAVIDGFMRSKFLVETAIGKKFVGDDSSFSAYIFADDFFQVFCRHGFNWHRPNVSVSLNQGENGGLISSATATRTFGFATDIGFIGFNRAGEQIRKRAGFHGMADSVNHKPSRLIGYAERSMNLMAAHALLGSADQIDGMNPMIQRNVRILKDRADSYGKLLAAFTAFIKTLPSWFTRLRLRNDRIGLVRFAMRANRTVWPKDIFKVSASFIGVGVKLKLLT